MKVDTEKFINVSIGRHGHKYDYSKCYVEHSRSMVTIICPLHGEFVQKAYKHMGGNGCPVCKKRKTVERFVSEARSIHGDRYDYEKVVYTTNRTNVIISCKLHGDFNRTPVNHLKGHGCAACNHVGRYTEKYFQEYPNKKVIPATLYLVEMQGNAEKFLKIGITTKIISKRFEKLKGYEIKTVASYSLSLYDAFTVEQRILSKLSDFKYTPKNPFGGSFECFDSVHAHSILSAISSEIPNFL